MTQHISRAQWEQIRKRVLQVQFVFDPAWKCLIDGQPWNKCRDHDENDMDEIIKAAKERFNL